MDHSRRFGFVRFRRVRTCTERADSWSNRNRCLVPRVTPPLQIAARSGATLEVRRRVRTNRARAHRGAIGIETQLSLVGKLGVELYSKHRIGKLDDRD
jgi:hypothetical protein